jgi:hypothetical protein
VNALTVESNITAAYFVGDGSRLSNISNYESTITVDPAGSDTTGTGGVNYPFKTIQKAHDYAVANIDPTKRIVIKINAGEYAENLIITRTRTSFVGLTEGISHATRLSGTITIETSESIGGVNQDIVSFENILITAGSTVITVAGSFSHSTFFKDSQIYTDDNAKCIDVTNQSGNRIYITNCICSNRNSSLPTVEFVKTAYANINGGIFFNGTGKAMNITSSNAIIANSRFESTGATTMIGVDSSSLSIANSWIVNPSPNGSGIEIASGATATVGQVAFSVGSAAGSGFAVKGVSGSIFVYGNNLIAPVTNNKISVAMSKIPLGTTFNAV